MGRFTVSLDDKTADWVQTHAGDDVDAYFTDLVQRDQKRRAAEAELKTLLMSARASGISTRTPQQIMADIKAEMTGNGRL